LKYSNQNPEASTPKMPRNQGLELINSFDHIVKHTNQMGSNFTPPESAKNIVYVGQNLNIIG